jgi:hypothetical protein
MLIVEIVVRAAGPVRISLVGRKKDRRALLDSLPDLAASIAIGGLNSLGLPNGA